MRNNDGYNDGNQVAPLTREHPRRRYTPVDYPCCPVQAELSKAPLFSYCELGTLAKRETGALPGRLPCGEDGEECLERQSRYYCISCDDAHF